MKQLLIVNDDASAQELNILLNEKAEAEFTISAVSPVNVHFDDIEQGRYDVVILDADYSSSDCLSLCARLKLSQRGSQPILILKSSSTDVAKLEHCLQHGHVACLTKPIDPLDLITNLRMLVSSRDVKTAFVDSQAMLNKMVDDTPHPMWISDEHGTLIRINPACCKLLNINADEVNGKYNVLKDSIIIEQGMLPAVQRVFDSGEIAKFDLEYDTGKLTELSLRKTAIVFLEVTITPIFDSKGNVINAVILHVDKTETEKALAELRRNEKLLRDVAANYPNSYISIVEEDLTVGFTSGQEFKKLGIDPNEFIGLTLEQVFGDNANYVREQYLRAFAGETVTFELKFGEQWQLYHVSPLTEDDGSCRRIIAVVENITERKEFENALAEKLAFQQQLVDTIPSPVFYKDRDGRYIGCNLAFLDYFGLSKEEVLGKTVHEIAPAEIADHYLEKDNELWENPGTQVYEWKGFSRKDESLKDIIIHKATWNDSSGKVAGLVGVIMDITDRKTAEETLRKSEERYKGIIQSTASCIAVYEPTDDGQDFVFVDFNPEAEKVEKLTREEIIGRKVTEVFPGIHEFGLFSVFQKVWETGKPSHHPISVYKDDRIVGFRENYVYKLSSGEIVSVYQDLTDQKINELEREKLLKEATSRTSELEALLNGAELVLQGNDFETTARHIFDAARELIGAKSGYVALLSDDGAENELLFLEAGGLPCDVDPLLPMPIRGLREEAYKTGLAVYDNDFMNSKWVKFMPKGHVDLRNVMFAPLNNDARTVGIIGLANKPTDFTEDDKRIATAFGQLAAIALKNSRNLAALQASEQKHRTYIENAPSGIFIVNDKGYYIDANEEACRMTGYPREELLSINLKDIAGSQGDSQTFIKLKNTGKIHEEVKLIRKDGSQFHATLDAAAIPGNLYMAYCTDISRRKTVELALKKSEENYRLLAENSVDVIWKLDKRLTFTYLSQALVDMMGFQPEEWIGTPLWKHAKWREFAKMARYAIKTIKYPDKYPSVVFETKMINVHGEEVPLEIVAHANYNSKGRFIGLQGSTRDIRERKLAEEALRQSEKRYREAQKLGKVGNWEYNIQTEEFWGSDEAKRIYGFDLKSDTFSVDHVESCIPERGRVHQALVDLIEHEKEYNLQFEIIPLHSDQRKTITSIANVIRDEQGKPLKVIGVIQDVTSRIEADRALKSSESKYQILVENLQQKIFLKDKNFNFISVNSQFAADLGLQPQQMIGKNVFDLFPKELAEKYQADDLRILKTGKSEDIEERYVVNGEYRWVQTMKTPLKNDDGEVQSILGIFWDITDRKKTELELRKHRENLEEIVSERTDELQRTVKMMTGRELRMIELKGVIRKLRAQLEESGMTPVADDPLNSYEE